MGRQHPVEAPPQATGAQCLMCEALVEFTARPARRDPGDCTSCGEVACVSDVLVTQCAKARECEHEDHYYGHGVHIVELT